MADRLFVSTKKGLFELGRMDGFWSVRRTSFLVRI
jgi:hypothetical protein